MEVVVLVVGGGSLIDLDGLPELYLAFTGGGGGGTWLLNHYHQWDR